MCTSLSNTKPKTQLLANAARNTKTPNAKGTTRYSLFKDHAQHLLNVARLAAARDPRQAVGRIP